MQAEVELQIDDRPPLVAEVAVAELFGRYSYRLVLPGGTSESARLALLYGGNGSGKTTVLQLIWHLLSAADDRGHRNFLARAPFRRLALWLSTGDMIVVNKTEELVGSFEVSISRPNNTVLVARYQVGPDGRIERPLRPRYRQEDSYDPVHAVESTRLFYVTDSYNSEIEAEQAREGFIRYLEKLDARPLLLADDRRIYSDDPELHRIREQMTRRERGTESNSPQETRALMARELRLTVHRVNELLINLTLGAQTAGSAGANQIYLDVLRELSHHALEEDTDSRGTELEELLKDLARRTPRFEEFNLVAKLDADELSRLIEGLDTERRRVATRIFVPYLSSLRTRYNALEEAETLIRSLLEVANEFFVDKRMVFDARRGLQILTDPGHEPLDPGNLSSGERQLVMLVCTTVLARTESRLFLVDEPELSLGVNWQRRILRSLLELTTGTPLQFIAATHSIEIISGQRESVVRIGSSDGATD